MNKHRLRDPWRPDGTVETNKSGVKNHVTRTAGQTVQKWVEKARWNFQNRNDPAIHRETDGTSPHIIRERSDDTVAPQIDTLTA